MCAPARKPLPLTSHLRAWDAKTTFVLPPPGVNKNIMPSPRSWLLHWPARQIFHNVGSSNWAPCQSQAPQVASALQSGGAAWVGLEGLRSPHGRPALLRWMASMWELPLCPGLGRGARAVHQPAGGSPAPKGLRLVGLCGC